jgi:hypothetical protein
METEMACIKKMYFFTFNMMIQKLEKIGNSTLTNIFLVDFVVWFQNCCSFLRHPENHLPVCTSHPPSANDVFIYKLHQLNSLFMRRIHWNVAFIANSFCRLGYNWEKIHNWGLLLPKVVIIAAAFDAKLIDNLTSRFRSVLVCSWVEGHSLQSFDDVPALISEDILDQREMQRHQVSQHLNNSLSVALTLAIVQKHIDAKQFKHIQREAKNSITHFEQLLDWHCKPFWNDHAIQVCEFFLHF